jgi:mono/diheme cytochrome c family protein
LTTLCLGLIACVATPAPAPPPTNTPVLAADVHIPDLEQGQATWRETQCPACHGPSAMGGIGPQLASTTLSYEQFLQAVRVARSPKPAYPEAQLPDQAVYDMYAWVRTQIPPVQWAASSPSPMPAQMAEAADTMGMTIWTSHRCDGCHGVFAQGGPDAPALAGLNDPVEEELVRMRSHGDTVPEHSPAHISDEVFARLYEWIKIGCVRDECYH